MRCPSCGSDNAIDAPVCRACGHHLERRCAGCGTLLFAAAKFCGECGRAVAQDAPIAPTDRLPGQSVFTPRHLAERIFASKIALEGERKQVTVLFADLQGSMQLIAARDPDEARETLDPVLHLMMDAVHWYEGTVNQVMGDGIMALFGAPLAQEDHAVRACYAALRMHEAVERYARARPPDGTGINVRVGLNSGEVVVRAIGGDLRMDYSAVGQTTHVANRMEQMAAPGTTVMAPATAALVEGFVRARSLGARPVKGLAEPLEAFELIGAEAVRSRLQAHAGRLTKFVGRDAELRRLGHVMDEVRRGRGHVVAVVSEAGVGKSRLCAEFLRSTHARDCLVLETGCVSYQKVPYLPIVELLRTCFQVGPHDTKPATRQKVADKLASLEVADEVAAPCLWLLGVPVDDVRWERLDPELRRRRALVAVQTAVLRECARQPVILVFEDLHWIDAESQVVLDALVDAAETARLFVLVNYRPEYTHGWAGRSFYRSLHIDGLPAGTADELMDALLGADASLRPLKSFLAGRTDGNPFFIEESVRMLRESGALVGQRGDHRPAQSFDAGRVPATVQAVVAARIDRLPVEQKRLLQCAAVIGTSVPFPLLQEVSELPADELRDALSRLEGTSFLNEAQLFPEIEYAFRHTITHDVAYGTIVGERRKALHARIAEVIERGNADRLDEHVERLAHHTARADIWDKAARYLRHAGNKALSRSASREASTWFSEGLQALSRVPTSAPAIELAIDLRLDLRAALYALGEFEPMLEHLRAADALARELDDPRRQAWVSVHIGEHCRQTGNFGEAIELIERALVLGDTIGDVAIRSTANQYLGLACHAVGNFARAVAHMRMVADLPDDAAAAAEFRRTQAGSRSGFRAASLGWLARCLADTGDLDEGRAHGEEAIRIAERIEHPYSLVSARWGLGYLHAAQGDFERAVPLLASALGTARDARLTRLLPQVLRALGLAHALAGRLDDGVPLLEEALRVIESIGLLVGHSSTLAHLAEAYALAGRWPEADAAAQRALALACRHGQHADQASALRLIGDVAAGRASPGDARRAYAEAITLAESLGMRPLAARARLGLGLLLRREDDAAHRATLEAARDGFRALGMRFWEAVGQAAIGADALSPPPPAAE